MKGFIKGSFLKVALVLLILWCVSVYISDKDVIPNNQNDKNIELNQDVMSVTYIDVGQGDSEYICFPDGENMLIDGGSDNEKAYNYLKKNDVESIDYLVATHPHEDHIGGLGEICENIEIKNVFMPDISASTKAFNRFLKALDNRNVNGTVAKKGVVIKENDDLRVEILSPALKMYENTNDYSAVVKITYRDTSFLFMGDCEKPAESNIDKKDLKADVIKIGHHGSSTSSSSEFIKSVNPKYAVISVGKNNDYGHPHDKVLNRLYNLGIKVFRTDESGDIKIYTDGTEISVRD